MIQWLHKGNIDLKQVKLTKAVLISPVAILILLNKCICVNIIWGEKIKKNVTSTKTTFSKALFYLLILYYWYWLLPILFGHFYQVFWKCVKYEELWECVRDCMTRKKNIENHA